LRLRAHYTLLFPNAIPQGLRLPLALDTEGCTLRIQPVEGEVTRADAIVECPVDATGLTLRTGPDPIDGSQPTLGIDTPERAELAYFLSEMLSLVSFLVDAPIRYYHKPGQDTFIVETTKDRNALAAFPTQTVFVSLQLQLSLRTFSASELTNDALHELLQKKAGLALYTQALLAQDSLAAYRDYWKVLESAFALDDDRLVDALVDYPAVQQLAFTREELHDLLVLRGRASHAQTRSGITELRNVVRETTERLARLKCLVEQVILSKQTWGVPTQATKPLTDLRGYVNAHGNLVIVKTS